MRDGANAALGVPDQPTRNRLYGACAVVHPRVLWLGHDHKKSSYLHSQDYRPLPMDSMFRDLYGTEWEIDNTLNRGDINTVHLSLKDLDVVAAAHSTAAFIQARLYFGLLEAICARPISAS